MGLPRRNAFRITSIRASVVEIGLLVFCWGLVVVALAYPVGCG